jgi:hypothetical protein
MFAATKQRTSAASSSSAHNGGSNSSFLKSQSLSAADESIRSVEISLKSIKSLLQSRNEALADSSHAHSADHSHNSPSVEDLNQMINYLVWFSCSSLSHLYSNAQSYHFSAFNTEKSFPEYAAHAVPQLIPNFSALFTEEKQLDPLEADENQRNQSENQQNCGAVTPIRNSLSPIMSALSPVSILTANNPTLTPNDSASSLSTPPSMRPRQPSFITEKERQQLAGKNWKMGTPLSRNSVSSPLSSERRQSFYSPKLGSANKSIFLTNNDSESNNYGAVVQQLGSFSLNPGKPNIIPGYLENLLELDALVNKDRESGSLSQRSFLSASSTNSSNNLNNNSNINYSSSNQSNSALLAVKSHFRDMFCNGNHPVGRAILVFITHTQDENRHKFILAAKLQLHSNNHGRNSHNNENNDDFLRRWSKDYLLTQLESIKSFASYHYRLILSVYPSLERTSIIRKVAFYILNSILYDSLSKTLLNLYGEVFAQENEWINTKISAINAEKHRNNNSCSSNENHYGEVAVLLREMFSSELIREKFNLIVNLCKEASNLVKKNSQNNSKSNSSSNSGTSSPALGAINANHSCGPNNSSSNTTSATTTNNSNNGSSASMNSDDLVNILSQSLLSCDSPALYSTMRLLNDCMHIDPHIAMAEKSFAVVSLTVAVQYISTLPGSDK